MLAVGCGAPASQTAYDGSVGAGSASPVCEQAPDTAYRSPVVTLAFAGDLAGLRRDGRSWQRMPDCALDTDAARALAEADLAFANLEGPIVGVIDESAAARRDRVVLGSDLSNLSRFADLGVDVVALANNHSCDTPYSAGETAAILRDHGLPGAGLRGFEVLEVAAGGGSPLRIALIAMTMIPPRADGCEAPPVFVDADGALTRFDAARAEVGADLYIVSIHWGDEHAETPSPAQRDLAVRLHAAGAHVVWGHHSHTPQLVDAGTDGLTIYSAGDLCMDTHDSAGLVVVVTATLGSDGSVGLTLRSSQPTQAD